MLNADKGINPLNSELTSVRAARIHLKNEAALDLLAHRVD